jgi:Fe(3+) dicitrate transport protein
MKTLLMIIFSISLASDAWSQDQGDSIETRRLDEVVIKGQQEINVERLPEIAGTRIWSGKKNEMLNISNLDANVAEKTARQVFAKVPKLPGLTVCRLTRVLGSHGITRCIRVTTWMAPGD